jgi:hypothetical protein
VIFALIGAALVAMLPGPGSCPARMETGRGGLPPLSLQLTITGHASLDAASLGQARKTVRALLMSAGIRLNWRECHADDACGPASASQPVSVLLVPFVSPTHSGVGGQVVQGNGSRAATVTVYVPVLAEMARAIRTGTGGRSDPRLARVDTGHLVGLTIAHEVGHALLLPHARSGLMQPRFDLDDVRALLDARLAFTAAESAHMRCQLVPGGEATFTQSCERCRWR